MEDMNRYWDTWSPYWSYVENNMLDIEGMRKLSIDVIDPVLVIGAGQGMLVEQLLQKGFKADGVDLSPQMVKYAKDRRNIDLIHADARKLPFADGSYKTVIVATGVVDFMEDEQQIAAVIGEARRVTHASGKTLLAFCRFHPKMEEFLNYMGVVTKDGYCMYKRMCQCSNMRPREFLSELRKCLNVGWLHALGIVLKLQVSLPKKERQASRTWDLLWKKLRMEPEMAESLIETIPERVIYRREPEIKSLFKRLDEPIQRIYPYDSCTVVLLNPKK